MYGSALESMLTNRPIDNQIVQTSEMTFGSTKCKKLPDFITRNVIWANQKTE